jgi:hypothetical protein
MATSNPPAISTILTDVILFAVVRHSAPSILLEKTSFEQGGCKVLELLTKPVLMVIGFACLFIGGILSSGKTLADIWNLNFKLDMGSVFLILGCLLVGISAWQLIQQSEELTAKNAKLEAQLNRPIIDQLRDEEQTNLLKSKEMEKVEALKQADEHIVKVQKYLSFLADIQLARGVEQKDVAIINKIANDVARHYDEQIVGNSFITQGFDDATHNIFRHRLRHNVIEGVEALVNSGETEAFKKFVAEQQEIFREKKAELQREREKMDRTSIADFLANTFKSPKP